MGILPCSFSGDHTIFEEFWFVESWKLRGWKFWHSTLHGSRERPLPSTRDVSRVTLAALRLPAGRFSPIFSNLSLKHRPPFFDLALKRENQEGK